jgi:uncharacterized protein
MRGTMALRTGLWVCLSFQAAGAAENKERNRGVMRDGDSDVPAARPLPGVLQPLLPGEIRLNGELGRRMTLTVQKNLAALDFERDFLRHFQERVPYPRDEKAKKAFLKQGRMLFNGLGETLDALVFFAAYSGDAAIVALKDRLFKAILATQEKDGYIGQFAVEPQNRQLPTDFAFEDGSYLALALANHALYFKDRRSLDAAARLVRCMAAADRDRADYHERSFSGIGFCDAALTLYRITGEDEFLEIARTTRLGPGRTSKVQSLRDWVDDRPFQRGWHDLRQQTEAPARKTQAVIDDGTAEMAGREKRLIWHVYRHLERMTVQMQLHRVDPDERYLRMTRMIAAALLRREHSGLAVTGGMGRHEGWCEDQDCGHGLGETCASGATIYYLQELINLDSDLRYGDVMERVIYNQLFAAQAPAGRQLRYFTPASGKREYYKPDIFCCPGNYRRALSRLPQSVFYRFRDGIAVNLFNACEAQIRLSADLTVKLSQKTRYPSDGRIEIRVSASRPADFPLRLRTPRWCREPRITLNGQPASSTIRRTWGLDDQLVLDFPMPWRFVRGRDLQAGRAALMRGPLVFTLSRVGNGLPENLVLRDIVLDPASVEGPVADRSIRPDGLACHVRGWSPGRPVDEAPDLRLKFTEYPDPDGEEIYFRLSNADASVEDEWL